MTSDEIRRIPLPSLKFQTNSALAHQVRDYEMEATKLMVLMEIAAQLAEANEMAAKIVFPGT